MPEEIFFFVSRFFDRPDKFEWMPRPAGRSIRIVSDPGNNPGPGLSATTVMLASLLLLTPVCQPGIRPDAVVIIHSGAAAMLLRGGKNCRLASVSSCDPTMSFNPEARTWICKIGTAP